MRFFYFPTLLIVIIVLISSCKKEEYRAPSIAANTGDTIILNIGDKTMLAPNITNLKGNTYTWSVNGKQTSTGQINYTFEATEAGNFDVTFKANNKGGHDEQTFRILVEERIVLTIDSLPAIPMSEVYDIKPVVKGPNRTDYTYEWTIGDSVISKQLNLSFISPAAGSYVLTLRARAGKQTATTSRSITVDAKDYVRNAYKLLEYLPAPAKGHNWSIVGYSELWQYGDEFPSGYNDFLLKATELRKEMETDAIVLGSWGSSATFQFDHTVANVPGKPDIAVSATYSNMDKPAVYVAYDRNKNGKADEDEWYEIKGDDYGLEDIPDYEMTFTYDSTASTTRNIFTYFSWKDNQETPAQGQIVNAKSLRTSTTTAGAFSTKGFFPGYYMPDISTQQVVLLDGWQASFTRKGKRITKDLTGAAPFIQTMNLDLDNAVNSRGESVQLPGINFVKVLKTIYPLEKDVFGDGTVKSANMEEGRMLHVGAILDLHLEIKKAGQPS